MKLIKLVLKNFLGTADRTIDFGKVTQISGRNGSGKSSIKEGIIFALYGKINGQDKLIDGAIMNDTDHLYVRLEVEHKGTIYIIERNRTSKDSTIKVNGKATNQNGLDFIFDSYETFISAFAVGDFMKLEENMRYEILSSLFPDTREEIYKRMVGDLATKYPFELTKVEEIKRQIKNFETEMEIVRQKKLLASESINTLRKAEAPVPTVTEESMQEIRDRLDAHAKNKPVLSSNVETTSPEIEDLKKSQSIRVKKWDELRNQEPSRAKIDELKTRYQIATQEKEGINVGVCPTCNRAFDKEEAEQKITNAQMKLDAILSEGREAKKEYEALMLGWNQEVSNLANEVRSLDEKINIETKSIGSQQSSNIDEYKQKLGFWEEKQKELTIEYNEAKNKYSEYRVLKNLYDQNSDHIKLFQNELATLDKSLEGKNLLELEKIRDALGPKGVEFEEIQSKITKVLEFFPEGTDIELLRKNKTNDEYKKVFSVSVHGVNYNWLSKGMKKVFDIYVAEVIGDKLGIDCLCIDDNESLTTGVALTNREKQVVTLTARDEDFIVK